MIELITGNPTDEEIAAIVAALAHSQPEPNPVNLKTGIWGIAARYPELDIEDLRRVF